MKILIFSDSHGYADHMCRAVEEETPDYVIHLGDGQRDVDRLREAYPRLPIAQVCGNCDYGADLLPDRLVNDYGGVRMLLCHGHQYHVKSSLLRLNYAARECGAKIALFGHTHQPHLEQLDEIWLMNPGSCGYGLRPTCGIIEVSGGRFTCQVKPIEERKQAL